MNDSAPGFRSEWVPPPKSPDAQLIAVLGDSFRSRPQIAEAWLLGTRMLPVDGSATWEASMIGLVLDPPPEEGRRGVLALYDDLTRATGWGGADDEGWQVLSPAEVGEHAVEIENLYSRETRAG